MPRVAKELSALEVRRLKHPGQTSVPVLKMVGGIAGLGVQITASGAKSWILRTTILGKRRDLGLGPYPEVSLANASQAAREVKAQIRAGKDPLAERRQAKAKLEAEERRRMTFKQAVDAYCATKLEELTSDKHRNDWVASLNSYAVPVLGSMPVGDIEMRDVLQVVEPMWLAKTATASRLRGRIEKILDWCTVKGYRAGENPARWAGNLKELLPKPRKVSKVTHKPALAVASAPAWWAALAQCNHVGAEALKFITLTGVRSNEALGAHWNEFDLVEGVWVVPAERMKMKREHRVPLPAAALALLEGLKRDGDLVFRGPRGGQMRDHYTSELMRKMNADSDGAFVDPVSGLPAVPHGLRSTFRQWCAEQNYPRELAEAALAHQVGNAVERSYQRSDMIERRRALMQGWSEHLAGTHVGKVVRIA